MNDRLIRAVGDLEPEHTEPVRRGRNIIAVIGIDEYEHWRRLNNAVSDAQGVRDLFINVLGFQELFPPLYNAEASLEAINSLVLDQLNTELKEDDSLILFFAGHGHTEVTTIGSQKVETGYLIPAGGRLPQERRFGRYLKLDSFLRDVALLPPRHIMVILDACYSGFALGQTVSVLRDQPERYTDELDRRFSRHVITSAMYDQPALDNGPIFGHSLFTGTLIEALQTGGPDAEGRGFVTGSELALYVQKQVLEYASQRDSKQTPDYGYFEHHQRGELVIALRGETHNKNLARERFETGQHGEALGRFSGDRRRFAFAANQYRQAVQLAGLAKMAYPEAELGLGRALLASADASGAVEALETLVQSGGQDLPSQARFFLGMAYASQKDYARAAENLSAWTEDCPEDENRPWVQEYVEWLQGAAGDPGGRRLALLVGIDEYSLDTAVTLKGCANDVRRLMKPALTNWLGFQEADIVVLTNGRATCKRLRAELEKLARTAKPGDSVLIHFSGHSVPSSKPEFFGQNQANIYLILHDTAEEAGTLVGGMAAADLHQLVQAIPAGNKTLILDTHSSFELAGLAAAEGSYSLVMASDTAEIAYEWQVQINGKKIPCGMLTGALYQALENLDNRSEISYADWFLAAASIANQASLEFKQQQNPYFIGLLDRCPFEREDPYLTAFDFVQRGSWPERTIEQLQKLQRLITSRVRAPFPQVLLTFGRGFLAKRAYLQAAAALQAAVAQSPTPSPEAWLGLAKAQSSLGDFPAAINTLQQALPSIPADRVGEMEQLIGKLDRLTGLRRRAAIILPVVWLDQSRMLPGSDGWTSTEALEYNLLLVKNQLMEKFNIQPEDITVTGRPDATVHEFLAQLDQMAGKPGLVFILSDKIKSQKGDSLLFGFSEKYERLPMEVIEDYTRQPGGPFIWVQVNHISFPR